MWKSKIHSFQRLEFVSSEFGGWFVSMQLQCFFVCLQVLICAIASFWQKISWVFFCSFFCFQSGALSLPICCVLELKHAMCCLLELKKIARTLFLSVSMVFIDFAMVFRFSWFWLKFIWSSFIFPQGSWIFELIWWIFWWFSFSLFFLTIHWFRWCCLV